MELTINVDETRFNELLQDELKNFTEQELHEICRDALVKQLSDPNTFARMFVKEGGYYSSDRYYASDLLVQAAKSVDLSPLFKDFQDDVANYLKEHHNDIIMNLMKDIFAEGLSGYLYNTEFTQRLKAEYYQDQQRKDQAMMDNINNAFHR